MDVAVFGGSGFLGIYLVNELKLRNHAVTVYDRAAPKEETEDVNYFEVDILNRELVINMLVKQKHEIVYNLAGFANLDKAVEYPYLTMQLNVLGNINIVDGCVKAGVKRFVYASSAYAMSNKGSFYGISKLTSEKLIEEYSLKYGLPYTILRYGSVYAEKEFENNYIYNLVEKAVTTGEINHSGDGNEIREYIHALDVAKLSADVIESDAYTNECMIFTGTEKMRRGELFLLINEILGNNIKITLKDAGYNEHHYKYTPYSYSPTLSKKLVANPHIDMGQGLLECIKAVYNKHPELQEKSDEN